MENNKFNNKDFSFNLNKKYVKDKEKWLKVLKNEKNDNVIDVLLYLYDCKNYTSSITEIAKYFNISINELNNSINSFSKSVISMLKLDKIKDNEQDILWSVPFKTVPMLNKEILLLGNLEKNWLMH